MIAQIMTQKLFTVSSGIMRDDARIASSRVSPFTRVCVFFCTSLPDVQVVFFRSSKGSVFNHVYYDFHNVEPPPECTGKFSEA